MRLILVILLFFISSVLSDSENCYTKVVETNYGAVRGFLKKTLLNGKPYYAFRGIPYAKPPIGERRFKIPEPIEPWHPKIINAEDWGFACLQPIDWMTELSSETNEDCLYLNVFIPATESPKPLAVLFYVHGAAYFKNAGDDNLNAPDFLIEHDIVYVTFNYRLGIFGHLSLNTVDISGNQNMKDQQLALIWTHENIKYFGGDNEQITIAGHSSGATAAHFHAMNPISAQYIKRFISLSGSPLSFVSVSYNNHTSHLLERTQLNDLDELISHLMDATGEDILKLSEPIYIRSFETMKWSTQLEREDAIQPFLTEHPMKTYEEMSCIDKPGLFSFTDMESGAFTLGMAGPTDVNEFVENFSIKLPVRDYLLLTPDDLLEFRGLWDELKEFYYSNASTYNEKLEQTLHLFSDLSFTYGILSGVKAHVQKSCHRNNYLFQFAMDSTLNIQKMKSGGVYLPGAGHVDDLYYIFPSKPYLHVYNYVMGTKETNVNSKICLNAINLITKLLTNFIKYGEPSIDGDPIYGVEPVHEDLHPMIKLSNNGLSIVKEPHREKMTRVVGDILERAQKIVYEILERKAKAKSSQHSEL